MCSSCFGCAICKTKAGAIVQKKKTAALFSVSVNEPIMDNYVNTKADPAALVYWSSLCGKKG